MDVFRRFIVVVLNLWVITLTEVKQHFTGIAYQIFTV